MVSKKSVEKQLKRIGFKTYGWGRGEVSELPNVILPKEEIYEVVNGIYEGGFALLLATDVRVLLIDKKPLNYLTVEDMRFDMITEIDYSHRLLGANITISAGDKHLKFRSYNQPRLRKLIGHVQHCMAESKKQQSTHQEGQYQHLEQINKQLQSYLVAQQQQQQQLYEQLQKAQTDRDTAVPVTPPPEPIRPSPELSDYLYAQGLIAQYQQETGQAVQLPSMTYPHQLVQTPQPPAAMPQQPVAAEPITATRADPARNQLTDLYAEGMQEIFGKHHRAPANNGAVAETPSTGAEQPAASLYNPLLEINPLKVAYSKLPMALRNRKFGRPSFHAHSKKTKVQTEPIV